MRLMRQFLKNGKIRTIISLQTLGGINHVQKNAEKGINILGNTDLTQHMKILLNTKKVMLKRKGY